MTSGRRAGLSYSHRSPAFRPTAVTAFVTLLALGLALGGLVLSPLAPAEPRAALASGPVGLTLEAAPLSGPAPLLVAFSATVTPATGSTFQWTFGDGEGWNETGVNSSSPTHLYVTAGTFVVHVSVFNPNGATNTTVDVSVYNVPLSVKLTASTTSGIAPLTVNFSGRPSGGSGTYPWYVWTFGDGGVGSGPAVAYTYLDPGNYTVTLTVEDSQNHSASAVLTVIVNAPDAAPPTTTAKSSPPPLPLEFGLIVGGAVVAGAVTTGLWWRQRRPPMRAVGRGSRADPPSGSRGAAADSVPRGTVGGPSEGAETAVAGDPRLVPESTSEVSVATRVLLHLYSLGPVSAQDAPGMEWTQAGISRTLEVRQTTASRVLRELVASGAVLVSTTHVQGRGRRLRVYSLSPRGERLARGLWLARGRGPHDRDAS